MSKTVILISSLFLSLNILLAQKTTGVVTYTCTNVEGSAMASMMLSNSTQTIAFGKKTTLLNFNAMNETISTKIYTNLPSKQTTLLMSVPFMGKYKVKMTEAEAKSYRDKPLKMKVTYDKKNRKKILGYDCYKAAIKTKDSKITVYVTDKINPKHSPFQDMYPDLKGFPLEFQSSRKEATLTFKANKISKITKSTFKINSEGYEELTPEEFKQRMKNSK